MKRILITGTNSYLGFNLKKTLDNFKNKYKVFSIDMKKKEWENFDFSNFDVVFHVAGIVHVKSKRKSEYQKINVEMPEKVLRICIKNNVKQFIFMSSMSVYGDIIGEINEKTKLNPESLYGNSKRNAEKEIIKISKNNPQIKISIIRAPMIYGKNCKGNFDRLMNFSKYLRYIPKIINKRSMIYIENFIEFVKSVIDKSKEGFFHPQNNSYVSTNEMITLIRKIKYNKNTYEIRLLNFLRYLPLNIFRKLFRDSYYSEKLSGNRLEYNKINFIDGIKRSIL